jgi:hypothetical protein
MANSDNEGSYGSRKFVFSIVTSALITVLGFISSKYPSLGAQLPNIIAGLLGVLAIYTGANVGHHFVNGKFGIESSADDDTDKPDAVDTAVAATAPAKPTEPKVMPKVVATAVIAAATGSLTITPGSPADADGMPESDASE